jgi:hypothetical protein
MFTIDVLTADRSAFDTAVILTAARDGVLAGAVYTPADVIVPTFESPPVIPLTCHVTESSVVLAIVAVKVCVPLPTSTLLDTGHTASSTLEGVTVHDFSVALAGALDVAEVGLRTTLAVSTRPTSSVTAT